jgi:hypothetical protein
MATKKKKEPPFKTDGLSNPNVEQQPASSAETMFSGITDRVNQKMRSFRLGVGERQIGSALESANKAQQEPTFQQMNISDSRRGLEAEDAANDRARRDLEFKREMNPNQNQEDLDALQSEVIQERQSEIFKPTDLLPAGRAEFDAASRGEIPGYAIKDPGARAAFARARQSDPGFGSKERVNAEREPIPFDQELMDDLEFEGQQRRNDLEDRGLSPVIDARIRTYEEAKKNGRLSLYDAKTIGKFERAIKRRDEGDYSFEDEFEGESMNSGDGDFDYDAMGKRAQKGQQPRSAGGVGDGPLRAGMDPKSQSILEKRLADAEERIKNAGEKADPKDLELRDNLNRVLGAPKINRTVGDDIHGRASHGSGKRRFQNQPRGGGGGGVAGGGFTPGRTPAYNDRPLSASMQDPVTPDGKGYTLSDGTIMPDPDGMSEADFAGAVADNPVVAAEAFEYATENDTMTQKQRDTYNRLRQSRPDDLRPDQIETFNRNRQIEMGRLAADVFRANKAHAEQARSKAARDAKTAANESRTRMNRLERIYRQHLDPDTKNKVDSLGNLYASFAQDEELVKAVTRPLTEDEFRQAAQWEADQTGAFNAMQGKNAGAVAAIQQGEAPAPSDEEHWQFVSQDIGFGDQVTGAQSSPTGDRYGVIVEGDQVFLRLPAQDEWENVSEEDRMAVAGIILPPEGTGELEWMDFEQPIQSGAGGQKIMANPDGTLATEEAATEEAATEEAEKLKVDGSAGRVIQSLPEVF